MIKFLRDLVTDEYGHDADLTSVASIIGFALGMILYLLSQMAWTAAWVPKFDLVQYAIGFAALIGSVAGCQRLKPRAATPSTLPIVTMK